MLRTKLLLLAFGLLGLPGCESQAHAVGNAFSSVYERLASTATGKGASLIGIEDAGGDLSATTVEGAIAEHQTDIEALQAAGGGGFSWDTLKPQSSPHAKSYYPNDGDTLAGIGISEWDVPANQTVTESGGLAKLAQTSVAGFSLSGLYETVPAAAQYRIMACFNISHVISGDTAAVVWVGEDVAGAPTTANWHGAATVFRSSGTNDTETWHGTSYANVTVIGTYSPFGRENPCLGVWVDTTGNKYWTLWSEDGLGITVLSVYDQASSNVSTDPVTMGVAVDNIGGSYSNAVYVASIVVDETSDPFLPVGGFP